MSDTDRSCPRIGLPDTDRVPSPRLSRTMPRRPPPARVLGLPVHLEVIYSIYLGVIDSIYLGVVYLPDKGVFISEYLPIKGFFISD